MPSSIPPALQPSLPPGLYLVSTPIGNLEDITLRALKILREVDRIACEDTRRTGQLLAHYGIKKPLQRYDDHAGARARPALLKALQQGERIALVSDAGTPIIADPGYKLVREASENSIPVIPVPGACAAIAALSASGLPTDTFIFLGFSPRTSGARRSFFERWKYATATLILYESGNRLASLCNDALFVLGDRPACLARELTKLHETFYRNNLSTVYPQETRGEYVVIIGGASAEQPATGWEDALTRTLITHSPRDAAALIATQFQIPKRTVYQKALALHG
ncbi:MAG: 16S rRNA (cytidine(1402)-2'-O)-methyltransferase [Holosporales bacterium]|jgi:16S rRNA (cytidine1402-2'-O)-methyltransferase